MIGPMICAPARTSASGLLDLTLARARISDAQLGEAGRPGRAKGGRGAGPRLLSRLEDMHLELNCRRFLSPVR